MKKIAFVTTEFITPEESRTGGLGTYIWNMSNILSDAGFKVFVYSVGKENQILSYNDGSIVHRSFKIKSFKISFRIRLFHFFTTRYRSYSYLHFAFLKHQAKEINIFLGRELHSNPVDFVQYSNLNAIGLYPIKNIPCAIRISSLTHLYSNIGKGYYGLNPLKVASQIRIENISYKKINFLLGPSSFLLSKIQAFKIQKRYRIPTPVIKSNIENHIIEKKDIFQFACFGSLDYRKGVDLLLDAAESLEIKNFELLLLGHLYDDSPENINIKHQILNRKNVRHFQSVPKSKLFSILKIADVIILPSRVDNFPNSILESMSLGKIVIGPNAWGFEEVIVDGCNGFLFQCGSINSLIDVINKFLKLSEEEKSSIEYNALKTSEKYTAPFVVNEILEVYQKCITNWDKSCAV